MAFQLTELSDEKKVICSNYCFLIPDSTFFKLVSFLQARRREKKQEIERNRRGRINHSLNEIRDSIVALLKYENDGVKRLFLKLANQNVSKKLFSF